MCLVQFGSMNENDTAHGIRSGKIKFTGFVVTSIRMLILITMYVRLEMESFFEPAIQAAIIAIQQQIDESRSPISVCRRLLAAYFNSLNSCHRKSTLSAGSLLALTSVLA